LRRRRKIEDTSQNFLLLVTGHASVPVGHVVLAMTAEAWNRHSTKGWRRGQLESLKLMSKSQAALLRAYAVDRIHERDSLVEAALAFVVSTAETPSNIEGSGSTSANDENVYDAKAVQELLEWRERLG
ncbi:unnamed protein product, partial [Ectocarpus sp. 13 AM-2016]